MNLNGTEVKTIEEAFSLLPTEEQEHARRVAAYSETAFARACARNLYIETMFGKTELVIENRSFARESGLYHDIGKLCENEVLPPELLEMQRERGQEQNAGDIPAADHTAWGQYLIRELYPKFRSSKTYHQRMLLNGAGEHHERMDGSGTPWHTEGKNVSYMGRIVAIANELDHRAMKMRSEDPIGSVLKELKAEAAKGLYDDNFLKCFSASAASLRKTFSQYSEKTEAIPQAEMWIKRRSGRPMELRYRKCRDRAADKNAWLAEMHFRDTKGSYIPYEQMSRLIDGRKLGAKLGEYFLYELCDTLSRFELCGADTTASFIRLPDDWYSQRKLSERIAQVLKDEKLTAEHIAFLLPVELIAKPTKQFTENLAACEAAGYRLLNPEDAEKTLELPENAPLLTEDEIAAEFISRGAKPPDEESGADE